MDIKEYVDQCWENADYYIKGIKNRTIKSNRYIFKAISNFVEDVNRDDLEFKTEKVEQVFKFFYFLRLIHNNRVIRFDLLPFQCWFIMAIFGFYIKGTNKRKIKEVFLFMGKGNGKSPFAAALINYFMLGDSVIDPQALILANTRNQAKISLDFCKKMIFKSPVLSKRLAPYNYNIIFKDKKKTGFAQVMSSEIKSMDGYSANGAILDELHSYENADIYNMIKGAVDKRSNSLLIIITTAGTNMYGFLYDKLKYYKAVLEGDIKNESIFSAIYCLDDEDDYQDSSNWIKANPALDNIFPISKLKELYNSSKFSSSEINNFLTKRMNVFADSSDKWISTDKLSKVFKNIEEDLTGLDCYIGIDLSQTRDLTCLVCLFNKNDIFYVKPYFFMPRNDEKTIRSGGINIKDWVDQGYIIQSSSETVDYDLIINKLKEINSKYKIKIANYDPYNSSILFKEILNSGLNISGLFNSFQQKATTFNQPLKYLEKIIYDENIIMDNPVLKWNFDNVKLFTDGNANIKIMKNKSDDSVDGVVALGMAVGGYLDKNKNLKDLKSIYN